MYRRLSDSSNKFLSHLPIDIALFLMITVGLIPPPANLQSGPFHPASVAAQSLGEHESESPSNRGSNKIVRKEDVDVMAAFILLQRLLPIGAHLSSGFRDKDDQINVIRHYAEKNGIAVPAIGVTDPNAWRPAASALRGLGYRIADPDRTPHSSNQKIVMDIARANLGSIQEACFLAEKKEWIDIVNLIYEERNRAIHVELNITQKGMYELGFRQTMFPSSSSSSDAPQTALSPSPEDEEAKRKLMQELTSLHDGTPDPLKKIDFDLRMKKLFDPFDRANLGRLDDEIERHRAEAKGNESNETKQALIRNVQSAEQLGNLQEAEQAADRLAEAFPEEKKTLAQLKIRRLVRQAIELLVKEGCKNCEEANRMLGEALNISASDERAQRIKRETEVCLSECRSRRIALIVLSVLLGAGLIVGFYFWLRPKKWVLECIDGPCQGQVFPLEKEKLIIGALDSFDGEEGAADIVISDPNHQISRVHCSLRQSGRHFYLKDKSRNGTKVNTRAIEKDKYVKLANGDEISLADEAVLLFKRK